MKVIFICCVYLGVFKTIKISSIGGEMVWWPDERITSEMRKLANGMGKNANMVRVNESKII